jgi:DNA-binding beta-propeller fold protein YncE
MTQPIRFSALLKSLLRSSMFFLTIVMVCAVNPLQAAITLPVMVDYFDTAGPGSTVPQGVACITSGPLAGNFAVVDSTADKVFIIDPDGLLKDQFDTTGFSSTSPMGITFISNGLYAGDLAIVDNLADKIFVVDTSGLELHQCSTADFGSNNPQGITFIPTGTFAGNLAVVDSSDELLYVVDFDCTLIDSFDTSGYSPNPFGVGYDSANDYFAVLNYSPSEVTLIDTSGIVQDNFSVQFVAVGARGICYMPATGNFAVADDTSDEVYTINIKSQFIRSFNTNIWGSTDPVGITYIPTSGNYAIVDDLGDEVYFVSPLGVLDHQCDISAFSNNPKGIEFLPGSGEEFAIVDSLDREVYVMDSSCTLLRQFDILTFGINSLTPTGIAYVSATGDLAITDSSRDAILSVNPIRPGRLKSQLSTSAVLSTSPTGSIFFPSGTGLFAVVDNSVDEVFVLNNNGTLMARFDTATVLSSTDPQGIAFNPTAETLAILDNDNPSVSIVSFPGLLDLPYFCECDLNKDGSCNILDYQMFIQDWGCTDCP